LFITQHKQLETTKLFAAAMLVVTNS